jgi:hypothetical protein
MVRKNGVLQQNFLKNKKLSTPYGSQTQLLSVNDHSGDDYSARNHQHLEIPGQVAGGYSQV